MSGMIALCADGPSLAHPELIGLEGVDLNGIEWLTTFSRGAGVRRALANGVPFREIWIVSSEDIPAVNLVGALRKDGFAGVICMVTKETSGSALSCAKNAGASEVLSADGLAHRYFLEANRRIRMGEVGAVIHAPERAGNPRSSRFGARSDNLRLSARAVPTTMAAAGNGAFVSPRKGSEGFLLAVMSGSGGVGKSAICACAASALAEQGRRVLLIDGDLQFGDVAQMLSCGSVPTMEDVAADRSIVGRLASECMPGEPAIIAAPIALEQSEALREQAMDVVLEAIKQFEVVIVDTGSNWAEMHARLLEAASCILFVVDQRSGSVRACKHALALCGRMGAATTTFTFALNRCSRTGVFTAADVSCALDGAHVHELREGGFEVEDLCASGMAATLSKANNPFALGVAELMRELVGGLAGAPGGMAARADGKHASCARSCSHIYRESGQRASGGWFSSFGGFADFADRKRTKRRKRRRNEPMVVQMGPDRTGGTSNGTREHSDRREGGSSRMQERRHVQVLS